MEMLEEHRCFEGWQQRWRHDSSTLNCPMTFSIFLPPPRDHTPPPVLYWLSAVIIYSTAVQGDDAPGQIVRAIELANKRNECDVLIVGRGGGSLEDLWSFNDERVARAIFASRIPIVSAVGHETDVTIADFVADLRAPTPSAAAEVVSRNQQELLRQVQSTRQRLEMAMDYYLANRTRRFTQIHHRLQQQHPQLRGTTRSSIGTQK